MARKIKSKHGHSIIAMRYEEALFCGFGAVEYGKPIIVCDKCNEDCSDEIFYYISVLNMVLCKSCYSDFHKNMQYYPEDSEFEKRYFERYCNILKI